MKIYTYALEESKNACADMLDEVMEIIKMAEKLDGSVHFYGTPFINELKDN